MDSDSALLVFRNMGVALAIGLLVGLERGWQQRDADQGQRVAGLRTLAIMGVAGGASGVLAQQLAPVVLGLAFVAVAAMLIAAHILSSRASGDHGITSEIAAFTTFALAALATAGQPGLAAASAVVVASLLGMKPELHRWIERLDRSELIAALQLLVLSVVVLPLLPNRGMGPWDTLNPFQLWLLIVLVAAISFAGHFAVRLLGRTRGILLSGIFGGLASATALTLSFARLARRTRGLADLLAVGVVLALAMEVPRMLAVAWVVSPALSQSALVPLAAMMTTALGCGLWLRRRLRQSTARAPRRLGPPFRLKETLSFAVLLIGITLAGTAMNQSVGVAGVYLVAALGAMGNLTAATLSIAQLANQDLTTEAATRALVVAAMSSVLFKSALAYRLGGKRLGLLVGASAALVAATGAAALAIMAM